MFAISASFGTTGPSAPGTYSYRSCRTPVLGVCKSIRFSDIRKFDITFKAALAIYAAMPKSIHRVEYTVLVELVRDIRLEANLTQTYVSEQIGRSQSFMSDVERGTRRLDMVQLNDLAQICGRSLSDVVAEFEARLKKKRIPGKR